MTALAASLLASATLGLVSAQAGGPSRVDTVRRTFPAVALEARPARGAHLDALERPWPTSGRLAGGARPAPAPRVRPAGRRGGGSDDRPPPSRCARGARGGERRPPRLRGRVAAHGRAAGQGPGVDGGAAAPAQPPRPAGVRVRAPGARGGDGGDRGRGRPLPRRRGPRARPDAPDRDRRHRAPQRHRRALDPRPAGRGRLAAAHAAPRPRRPRLPLARGSRVDPDREPEPGAQQPPRHPAPDGRGAGHGGSSYDSGHRRALQPGDRRLALHRVPFPSSGSPDHAAVLLRERPRAGLRRGRGPTRSRTASSTTRWPAPGRPPGS